MFCLALLVYPKTFFGYFMNNLVYPKTFFGCFMNNLVYLKTFFGYFMNNLAQDNSINSNGKNDWDCDSDDDGDSEDVRGNRQDDCLLFRFFTVFHVQLFLLLFFSTNTAGASAASRN